MGIAAALALLGAGGFYIASQVLGDDEEPVMAVRLVPASEIEAESFTDSVADVRVADAEALAAWLDSDGGGAGGSAGGGPDGRGGGAEGRMVTADAEVVYATRADAPCDADSLKAQLAASPDVASAWADLMGVDVEEVEATVDALTPFVLARDTAVTNSEYRDGRARQFPAVLQAGTPVFVDWRGVPKVKCSCGNPLEAVDPVVDVSDTTGERWDGYRPETVVSIDARTDDPGGDGAVEVSAFDLDAGEERKVALPEAPGSGPDTIELDGYLVQDDEGVHVLGEDGELTTVIDHPVATVRDDGMGGLIYQELRTVPAGCEYCSSHDPVHTTPANRDEAVIWHLPAGEADPVVLVDAQDHEVSWPAIGDTGTLDGHPVLVYNVVVHDPNAYMDEEYSASLQMRPLDGERDVEIHGLYSTWESYPGPYEIGDGVILNDISYSERAYMAYAADGSEVTSGCELPESTSNWANSPCPANAALLDGGLVVGFGTSEYGDLLSVQVWNRETGSTVEEYDLPPREYGYWPVVDAVESAAVMSASAGEWDGQSVSFKAYEIDLDTGEVTDLPTNGTVRFLRAPLVRRAP